MSNVQHVCIVGYMCISFKIPYPETELIEFFDFISPIFGLTKSPKNSQIVKSLMMESMGSKCVMFRFNNI